MKYLSIIILVFVLFTSVACNSSTDAKSENETEEHVVVKKAYSLDTINSIINWTRNVDYKHITKQVFLFGAYVDVTMDNVQYETTGEIFPTEGFLNTEDDVIISGQINLDLSLTRFYSDEEEQFFVNDEYPTAVLSFIEIKSDSSNNYTVIAEFIMDDSQIQLEFPAVIEKLDDSYKMNAEIIIQASSLPILNQPDPENVNLDEIRFVLNLVYSF